MIDTLNHSIIKPLGIEMWKDIAMTDRNKNRLIIIIAGMGMLLSTLDMGIINVALPFLQNKFHTSTSWIALSVIAYTMSLAIFILPFGYLSDRYGKLKVSFIGLLIFGVGSILCGISSDILSLILFRICQGIGAAALQATSAALITTLMDRKYITNALGILGIMIGLGPVLGPSIGGFFLSVNLWRLIFWINVPFAAIGLICNYILIKNVTEHLTTVSFDLIGSLMNMLMVIFLLSGLSMLSNQHNFIFSILMITIGLILGLYFYVFESKQSNPLINFKLLKDSSGSWLYLSQTIIFGFSSAMIFLLPPFIFGKLMGFDSGLTGVLILGAPVGLVIFSKISGKINDGSQNKRFSLLGLIIIAPSLVGLLCFNPQWPAVWLTILLFIYGVGGGYFQPANIAMIMQIGHKSDQASIGSLQRMIQNIAIASGTAIGSTIMSRFANTLDMSIKINWSIALILVSIVILLSVSYHKKSTL